MIKALSRRSALLMAGLGSVLWSNPVRAAIATPRQTSGPFYPPPEQRPADTDWDLVKVDGQVRDAGGEVLWLFGQVLGVDGAPIPGTRVEIWQCDVNGRYHHDGDTDDRRPLDSGFQGFGAVIAGDQGEFRFRTIKPVAYPGRTPHIHARIVPPQGRELVTQLYMVDDPGNRSDFIFRSLGQSGQAAASIDPVRRSDGDLEAAFNFVL